MPNTPIIINNIQTRTIECIMQDGIKYCEKSELPQELAIWFLIFIIVGAIWGYRDNYSGSTILDTIAGGFLGFIFSLLAGGLLLLISKAIGF